jgi:hypothetical protein
MKTNGPKIVKNKGQQYLPEIYADIYQAYQLIESTAQSNCMKKPMKIGYMPHTKTLRKMA